MTAFAMDVRELSFDEIEMVSGGGWFSDLVSAIAHYAGQAMQAMAEAVEDAAEWFHRYFTVEASGDGVIVRSR